MEKQIKEGEQFTASELIATIEGHGVYELFDYQDPAELLASLTRLEFIGIFGDCMIIETTFTNALDNLICLIAFEKAKKGILSKQELKNIMENINLVITSIY